MSDSGQQQKKDLPGKNKKCEKGGRKKSGMEKIMRGEKSETHLHFKYFSAWTIR